MSELKNVLVVEDHKAILDHLLENASKLFGDAKLTVISEPSGLTDLDENAEFELGLVDPGLPGIPHDDISARVNFAVPLLNRIQSPECAAVFTGIATEPERALFRQAGFKNYLSKADTSIAELADFFARQDTNPAPPKPLREAWTFLSQSEVHAHNLKDDHPDLTYRELAEKSGKSEEAFTQALKRARRKIKEYAS